MTMRKSHTFILERFLQSYHIFDCCSVIDITDTSMWYTYRYILYTDSLIIQTSIHFLLPS